MTPQARSIVLHLGLLAVLVVLGFILPTYHQGNLARILVLATYAIGYNVLFGYTGLLSLGHAMFFAAGMYGCGLAMHLGGWPVLPALMLGLLAAALFGYAIFSEVPTLTMTLGMVLVCLSAYAALSPRTTERPSI